MTSWFPDRGALNRPVYLALVDQIADAIAAGRLDVGERLPTHRRLAHDLDVSVQTVSRAYEELARRGLVSGAAGRGTFVTGAVGAASPPYIAERTHEITDLSMLKPVTEQRHIDRLRTALAKLATTFAANLVTSFRPNVVFARHRQAAQTWLGHCGVTTRPGNIVLTNGATPAITTALMTVANAGMTIATEAIGHHPLPALASGLGLTLEGIAIDGQGILPEALEAAAARGEIRAVFLLPNACGPTVAMMGEERRHAIVDVARRHDLQIIENDAWGPLIAKRPPTFAAIAPERTLYLTSFTKTVLPGLRLGYLVVPERMIAAANNRHLVTEWMATSLLVELATRWVEDGTALDLVVWQRRAMRRRQAMAAEALAGVDFKSHPESLHVWVPLAAGRSEDEVVARARLQGVAVAPGASFGIGQTPGPAIRICLGQPSEPELRAALSVIAGVLHGDPEPVLLL